MARDMPQTTAIRWNSLSRKAWEKHLSDVTYLPYQQSYAFGEVIAQHGGDVLRAELTSDGVTVGLCQIAVRKLAAFRLATSIMGPVWLTEGLSAEQKMSVMDGLGRTFPLRGLHALLLMPPTAEVAAEEKRRLRRVVSSYHTVLMDLTQEEDALQANLDGKWRNRLRAAEKVELTIAPLGRRYEQYRWLLEAERKQRQRIGYKALSPMMVPAFQDAGGKDSVSGFEVKSGAERIAGMMFFRQGTTATYHIGWASEKGRELNAMNLALWHSVRQLRKKGVKTLDLGGVDTDQAPGVARFKLGTGGRLLSQSGTWLLRPHLR